MDKVCICAFSYGWYNWYSPIYAYSILKNYPEYNVKIVTSDFLDETIKKNLNLISSNNIEIYEGQKMFKHKSSRWLINKDFFKDYKYAYIGDVDFIILKEEPDLLTQHIEHCKRQELPYSNMVRPSKEDKLSGLHFINVEDYYEKVGDKIEEIKKRFCSFENTHNETLLYNLVKDIGLPKDKFRPHHGIHLGCFRVNNYRIFLEKWKKEYNLDILDEMLNDKVFLEIVSSSPSKIQSQIKKMGNLLCPKST